MPDSHARRMTVAEFLEWDDGTDTRYELIDGQPVAMTPPAARHSFVVGALTVAIGRRLTPPCRVLSKVGVSADADTETYLLADLAVTCRRISPDLKVTPEPSLVAEILSPSTRRRDLTYKLDRYRAIDSVQDILIVHSETRRVQHWTRQANGWFLQDIIGAGTVRLTALAIEVPLDEIYAGLGLE